MNTREYNYDTNSPYIKLALNIEEIDKIVDSNTNGRHKQLERHKYYDKLKFGQRNQILRYMEEFKTTPVNDSVWHELAAPVFVVHPDKIYSQGNIRQQLTKIVVNPKLEDYDFQRLVDPYTAYQELSMFVGGILKSPTKDIPTPSDEVMAEIKGFTKFSFRKDKSK